MKNNYIKNLYDMIKYNFGTLIKFEVLYKAILGLIIIPLAVYSFDLIMKLTGFNYLTIENIRYFLLNPITMLYIILIIIFFTAVTIFDMANLIIIFDLSYHKKKIGLIDLVKISLNKCKNILKLENISIAFLVLFLIPFLNIGVSSNVISSIKIPEFIMDYIDSNGSLLTLYMTLYIFLLSILFNRFYAIHYMVIEDKNFKKAKIASKKMIEGSIFKDLIKIFIVQVIIALIYMMVLVIGLVIIFSLNELLGNHKIIESVLITTIGLFILIILIVSNIIGNATNYAIISSLFYKHKIAKSEKITEIKYKEIIKPKSKKHIFRYIVILLIFISIIGGTIVTYQVITGEINLKIENVRKMEITAHRGASIKYPENTMAAFKGAKKLGADWIELDVQQTKDGKIVVIHDNNLSRIAGVNRDVIDLTYDEIKEIDVGSFFNEKYKNERIPLLSKVIKYAKKNNIKLNIELKPTGKEINFEKGVIDIINKYNFKDKCVVTSQTYKVLENIKKYDKSIKTVYVMSIAIGNITELEYADAFSVEATNVTEKLVTKVHNVGKEIYAWTVNKEESINKMIEMNVDNIITDNIELGKELVNNSRNSDLINELLNELKK